MHAGDAQKLALESVLGSEKMADVFQSIRLCAKAGQFSFRFADMEFDAEELAALKMLGYTASVNGLISWAVKE